MKLYFDTSNRHKIIISLNSKRWEFTGGEQKSQQLLSLIDKITKNGSLIGKIARVEINLGPGSFTGLKVGVSVANALGWALDIPVNGKKQLVIPKYE
jgi:tRNA threonylcarbamoyladenosine biosynthesis protein TsaB